MNNQTHQEDTSTKPVVDRMDKPPQLSDIRNLKKGFCRWIVSNNIDVLSLKPGVDLLKKSLPYIQCLDDNFKSVQEEDVKTNKAFWKGAYNILSNQLSNGTLLKAKCLDLQHDHLQAE